MPPEPPLPRPLTPSRAAASIEGAFEPASVARSPVLDSDQEPSVAIARGVALHRLLQVLPGLADGEREAAARRYLGRIGASWAPDEREQAVGSVMRILAEPAFAAIFSGHSRAEVGIAGTLEIGGIRRAISGKIDRLAVTADAVLIVDYKTSRPAPSRLDEVSPAHIAQLALYRALLQPLYPGRAVEAALLFTETPRPDRRPGRRARRRPCPTRGGVTQAMLEARCPRHHIWCNAISERISQNGNRQGRQ